MLKRLRVYIDTSVIGGCFDPEFALWSNGLFEDFIRGVFRPVLSSLVAAEIDAAPEAVRERYAEILECSGEILEISREALELASAVNLELGYKPLQIYSPREVTHHGED